MENFVESASIILYLVNILTDFIVAIVLSRNGYDRQATHVALLLLASSVVISLFAVEWDIPRMFSKFSNGVTWSKKHGPVRRLLAVLCLIPGSLFLPIFFFVCKKLSLAPHPDRTRLNELRYGRYEEDREKAAFDDDTIDEAFNDLAGQTELGLSIDKHDLRALHNEWFIVTAKTRVTTQAILSCIRALSQVPLLTAAVATNTIPQLLVQFSLLVSLAHVEGSLFTLLTVSVILSALNVVVQTSIVWGSFHPKISCFRILVIVFDLSTAAFVFISALEASTVDPSLTMTWTAGEFLGLPRIILPSPLSACFTKFLYASVVLFAVSLIFLLVVNFFDMFGHWHSRWKVPGFHPGFVRPQVMFFIMIFSVLPLLYVFDCIRLVAFLAFLEGLEPPKECAISHCVFFEFWRRGRTMPDIPVFAKVAERDKPRFFLTIDRHERLRFIIEIILSTEFNLQRSFFVKDIDADGTTIDEEDDLLLSRRRRNYQIIDKRLVSALSRRENPVFNPDKLPNFLFATLRDKEAVKDKEWKPAVELIYSIVWVIVGFFLLLSSVMGLVLPFQLAWHYGLSNLSVNQAICFAFNVISLCCIICLIPTVFCYSKYCFHLKCLNESPTGLALDGHGFRHPSPRMAVIQSSLYFIPTKRILLRWAMNNRNVLPWDIIDVVSEYAIELMLGNGYTSKVWDEMQHESAYGV